MLQPDVAEIDVVQKTVGSSSDDFRIHIQDVHPDAKKDFFVSY